MNEKLLFLGTCACDFSDKLQTECQNRFDQNARRASCLLIGERVLVDCGPHVLDSMHIAGKAPEHIEHIFVTHLHGDHFQAAHVAAIAKSRKTPLKLWVRRDATVDPIDNVEIICMAEQTPYKVTQNISVTALDANHDAQAFPQWFLFDISGKKLLYALDGAWFLTKTCNYLKNAALDVLILDATCGEKIGEYRFAEHNSLPMLSLMLPSLKTVGILSNKTRVYLSHIAPSLHRPHVEIEQQAKQFGAQVACDGLTVLL